MALPPSLLPAELEFISEETLVHIVPLFSMEPIRLLSGIYGPFRPPKRTEVPLWMAVNLKGKRKCHIIPPPWLSIDGLTELLETEQNLPTSFAPLPSRRFLEISKVLLDAASDNLINPSGLRSLIKDLRECRLAKLRSGIIPQIGKNETGLNGEYLYLTNLTPLEINELRPFFVRAMGVIAKLAPPPPDDDAPGGQGRAANDSDEELN